MAGIITWIIGVASPIYKEREGGSIHRFLQHQLRIQSAFGFSSA